jgi:hypothetical protein
MLEQRKRKLLLQKRPPRPVSMLRKRPRLRLLLRLLRLLAPEAAKHVEPSSLAVANEAGRL